MANKYLDSNGLSYFFNKIKTFLANQAVVHKTKSIPFGQVDSTSTATVFTATVDGITELADGVCVMLKNGVVTSASGCTLDVNNLGAKPIYYTTGATSRVTTHFSINYTWLFVYNSTRVDGGCWDAYWGYDANTNDTTTGYMRIAYGQFKPTTNLYRYQVCLTKNEEEIIPVTAVSNNTGTAKALTTESFNPFAPIYYYSTTATVTTGTLISPSYIWSAYARVNIRYSFNTGTTLTENKEVYIRATLTNGIEAKLAADPITQELPSSDDGYIYIKLGHSCDNYRVSLTYDHPIYIYKNGAIRTLSGYSEYSQYVNGHTVNSNVPANAVFTDTVTTATTTGSGNAVTAITASNGALTVTKGTTFLTSHQDISGKADKSEVGDFQDIIDGTPIVDSDTITGAIVELWETVNGRVEDLEGMSVSTTGSGNAVTAVALSNGTFTVTKGATYMTSAQVQTMIDDAIADITDVNEVSY